MPLVVGLSSRKPGFDPMSGHVRFVRDRVALGQVLLRVLRFPPVSTLHKCPTLIFIYCCSYQKNKRAKAGNLPKLSALSEIGEHWIEKYFQFICL
jgi:hypothetical protein